MYDNHFRVSFTPLTGVLFTVPSWYLFAIGRKEYLALEGGPPSFKPDYTCPILLTNSARPTHHISPTGLLPALVVRSRIVRLYGAPSGFPARGERAARTTPSGATACTLAHRMVWAVPGSLVTTTGISIDFLSMATEIFHFTMYGSYAAMYSLRCRRGSLYGVSPFGYLRIKGCVPPPRSFSQAPASFIASFCQGIHDHRLSFVRFHDSTGSPGRGLSSFLNLHSTFFSSRAGLRTRATMSSQGHVQTVVHALAVLSMGSKTGSVVHTPRSLLQTVLTD